MTRRGFALVLRSIAFGYVCVALTAAQSQQQQTPLSTPSAAGSVAAPVPVGTPSAATTKKKLCSRDYEGFAKPLDLLRVTPERNPLAFADQAGVYPRILCFLYTISPWHTTRAQAVVDTWGQRCHKLVLFSNATHEFVPSRVDLRSGQTVFTKADQAQAFSRAYAQSHGLGNVSTSVEVVELDGPADSNHLWQRHRAGLRYIFDHFRQDFDWFYKADDDSYVILENLREYLKRPEILAQWRHKPMQLGHRFHLTDDRLKSYIRNKSFEQEFYKRFHSLVFNSGGAGYAMNGLYLDQLIKTLNDPTCFADADSQTIPEEIATALCMLWHDVTPWETRDTAGRERWHSSKPTDVFHVSLEGPDNWYIQFHRDIGGVKPGKDCCAPDSIAYHYITPEHMYHMERQLYYCRAPQFELDDFNRDFSLAISNRVLVYPQETLLAAQA